MNSIQTCRTCGGAILTGVTSYGGPICLYQGWHPGHGMPLTPLINRSGRCSTCADTDVLRKRLQDACNEICRLSDDLAAAKESEAAWKTSWEKADQRRLEAENREVALQEQLELARHSNRLEIIASELLAAIISNPEASSYPKLLKGRVCVAIEYASTLINMLDQEIDPEEGE